ncbi:MAG: KEOPS complex N(6)-L-threonylcarbamoyladenine synthase Kae1 [Promethearchaeota archaeon]
MKKFCLGIESTAHTWGVGIVDFEGGVHSIINDTFIPEKGGLHPALVREHHLNNFTDVIGKALFEARLSIKDINLIAFSQSPGLGPVLKIGALVARMLSQLLNIPLVGVNHCIAHVEIGRLKCKIENPLTLYVSGGNTIISAYESHKYQIFGETLDLAVGNMIDSFARDAGLSHPGGPKIEILAANSKQYLTLPYIVKGMDLSFSGLYTAAKRLLESPDFNKKYNLNDIAYSLQETAFAMLTEVTERALAHTEIKEVLLTGGVAANKRLQQMIQYISNEHDARFEVVPLRYAGDNGAMIAWTGILRFLYEGGHEMTETIIKPKERMDNITVPWRSKSKT